MSCCIKIRIGSEERNKMNEKQQIFFAAYNRMSLNKKTGSVAVHRGDNLTRNVREKEI